MRMRNEDDDEEDDDSDDKEGKLHHLVTPGMSEKLRPVFLLLHNMIGQWAHIYLIKIL